MEEEEISSYNTTQLKEAGFNLTQQHFFCEDKRAEDGGEGAGGNDSKTRRVLNCFASDF